MAQTACFTESMTAASADQSQERPEVDPGIVLSSIGEAVYSWDIATDTLSWSSNAASLFGLRDPHGIGTGAAFDKLLDPVSTSTRSEAVLLCDGRILDGGMPYRLSFAVSQVDGPPIWFEDTGRWFAGPDGRAAAAHGVVRRIAPPQSAECRELSSAHIDELTGGYLRGPFLRLIGADLSKGGADRKPSMFCLMAIDDLDFVNSAYGFEIADEVIAGVARRIRGTMRSKDRLVRYSGSKLGVFLTVFEGAAPDEAVRRFMVAVAAEPIDTSACPVAVRLQVGCAVVAKVGVDPIVVAHQAEEALKEARSGSGYAVYRADADRDSARRRNLSASEEVVRALNDRRVTVAMEPVICARTRVLQFHEVLVRVRTEDGAVLGAGAIVPTAERFGLIKFVDLRVLELTVKALTEQPLRRLSANVSMRTAVTPEWFEALAGFVAADRSIQDRLIVEITETAAMSDLAATAAIISRVKDLGLRVAIDDFGSGHTSFRSLRALPIDILKIDGVFIQNLARSADDRFFVRTLIDLAGNLGVQTVAEWVQDEESARQLSEWGVTFLQGEFCGAAEVVPEERDSEPLSAVA